MHQTSRAKRIRALERAISYAYFHSVDNKPGKVIEKMPKEDREILKELTSDDTLTQRIK